MSISSRDIRLIAVSLHITGYRDLNTEDLFRKIVEMKNIYDNQKANGLDIDEYIVYFFSWRGEPLPDHRISPLIPVLNLANQIYLICRVGIFILPIGRVLMR